MFKKFLFVVLFSFFGFHPFMTQAGQAPVFYEMVSSLGSAPFLPIAANSSGEYFAVDPRYSRLIILNNSLEVVTNVSLPSSYSSWYNEIAVGPDDSVWVSSGYYSKSKIFLKYDSSGNLLDSFYYENSRMVYVSNGGIQLDSDGYLYFISSMYSPYLSDNAVTTYLNKLDPKDGSLIQRWEVPVDGSSKWYRGLSINTQGEVFWGNFESRTIYKFDPLTGQTVPFAFLPAGTQENTSSLALGAEGSLYVIEKPSVYWRYYPSYLYLFDNEGAYRGNREIDFHTAGVYLATFEDEIVISSYITGLLIKYTSICKNSIEYPYCVHTVRGAEEVTRQYMALERIKEQDGQKILLELKKVSEDMLKGMVDNAKNDINMLIHYIGVKKGKTIPGDVSTVLVTILENTRDAL